MTSAVGPLHAAVLGFRQAVLERHLGLEGLHIHVRGHGSLAHRWVADLRRDVFSVSKTFTSVAVGIAESEGLLNLDDPVLKHLPEFSGDAADGVDAMSVRHLLSMTAGNEYRWVDSDADHPDDPARDFLATPLVAEPGTSYHYGGTNTYVLGRVIHACSGQDLRDFLMPRLFAPLGIRNPQWQRCPLGFPLGAIGLFLRTEEIARLGETLLNQGCFGDQQLVPARYVSQMTTETTDTGRAEPDNQTYGLHAWLCSRDNAWRMDGIYGQFSIMLPDQGACVTVTSHYEGPTTDILDAIWSELVPHLDSEAARDLD
jgi:CubicO group peptidase (beta-lactamase class C family)